MLITTTGLFDTGSSAVFVLLREYASCDAGVFSDLDNEHLLLYTPNGLFDLEDKLLHGNNIHRSDEALHAFWDTMRWLYDNNFHWFGNYKKLFGQPFMDSVNKLIDELTDMRIEGDWYYDYIKTKFSWKHFIKNAINALAKKDIDGDFGRTIIFRENRKKWYSYASPEKFYGSAKDFINEYIRLSTTQKEKNLILDHFILPQNLHRLPNYFSKEEIKVINVERDPRDVYVHLMQEVNDDKMKKGLPTDVKDFVVFWKGARETVKPYPTEYVLNIWFEDFLLNFASCVQKIEKFCGLNSADWTDRGRHLNVERSLKNVGIYKRDVRWQKEVKYIEKELADYLYHK